MKLVDVANLACGYHAGDPSIMIKTVRLAKKHNVRVGAHPGMPDLLGFGRRQMVIDPEDMYALVLYQVGALVAVLKAEGMQLNHVKPHGELYFYINRDPKILNAVLRAVRIFSVPMYGLYSKTLVGACEAMGVELIPEFFPDIDYDNAGQLVPITRSAPVTPELVERRVHDFAMQGNVTTIDGSILSFGFGDKPFTICIHSDLPTAIGNATAARAAVDQMDKEARH